MHCLQHLGLAFIALIPFVQAIDVNGTDVPRPGGRAKDPDLPAACHVVCDPVWDQEILCDKTFPVDNNRFLNCICASPNAKDQLPICAACRDQNANNHNQIDRLVSYCSFKATTYVSTSTVSVTGTTTMNVTTTATAISTSVVSSAATTTAAQASSTDASGSASPSNGSSTSSASGAVATSNKTNSAPGLASPAGTAIVPATFAALFLAVLMASL
ncbi:MAG: hypothetical protein M1829_004091 [Trizodia sp. TS-e1964]|nr:MAG: hypothetical protein M1829_004091 [Trizodia sp. TS-e1964]